MQQKPARKPSTQVRAERYGLANQMSHQVAGKVERESMKASLRAGHEEAKRKGRLRMGGSSSKTKEKGMNAGTYGGSRSAMLSTFFGKKS